MKTAINNARIFDGSAVRENFSICFDENGILAVGPGPYEADCIMDGTGKTVTPGLIDGHVHLGANGMESFTSSRDLVRAGAKIAAQAQEVWKYGITTVCNCATDANADIYVRDMIRDGIIPGCRIIACGKGISITGGHGWNMNHECDDDVSALTAARLQTREGADLVKFFATGGMGTKGSIPNVPQLTESQMHAGVLHAEAVGALTRAHATGLEGAQRAIRAGVRIIDHAQLDEETAALMAEYHAFYCPTIVTRYNILHTDDPRYQYMRAKAKPSDLDRKKKALELCLKKGITILAGTDGGPNDLTPLGSSLWTELNIYTEFALTPVQALTAATSDAAKALRLESVTGSLKQGMQADLAVFDGNPTEDMKDIQTLSMTIQGGKIRFKKF